eukprot:CAMPEP_0206433850 /NCGR_PEP_ID=MMETSP0324_2-20121206/8769_1 /ASSEMBLY_ACC=CAM_ASM_000836 /TAXON_ID=2866 /ORGANISM="Crypthecodinium cohnii, Strain Seligo" /LENGTH=612 /DNA_ID=CAMNT_0053900175 /DNA_START=113 /DNA_END=1948 /DNA_ORIENTATION=+
MGASMGCVRAGGKKGGQGPEARVTMCQGPGACSFPSACSSLGTLLFEEDPAQGDPKGKGGYAKLHAPGQDRREGCCSRCCKKCCALLFMLAVLICVGLLVLTAESEEGLTVDSFKSTSISTYEQVKDFMVMTWENLQDHMSTTTGKPTAEPGVAENPESVDVSTVTRYTCATGVSEKKVNLAIYSEWDVTDADRDGQVTRDELMKQKATLAPATLQVLLDADVDGSGTLSFEEFAAALGQTSFKKVSLRGTVPSGADEPSDISSWTLPKREWCCNHWGVACDGIAELEEQAKNEAAAATAPGSPLQRPPATPTKAPSSGAVAPAAFDCEDGAPKTWSAMKKNFCCDSAQVGCESPTSEDPYDCEAGLQAGVNQWTVGKKDWCCRHRGVACQVDSAPQLNAFASELPATKKKETSKEKEQEEIAVQEEEEEEEEIKQEEKKEEEKKKKDNEQQHTCNAECVQGGLKASCQERVQWLLTNDFRLAKHKCSKSLQTVIMDCSQCSACSMLDVGCSDEDESETTHDDDDKVSPYECTVNPPHTWSMNKQEWCCRHESRGCEDLAEAQAERNRVVHKELVEEAKAEDDKAEKAKANEEASQLKSPKALAPPTKPMAA